MQIQDTALPIMAPASTSVSSSSSSTPMASSVPLTHPSQLHPLEPWTSSLTATASIAPENDPNPSWTFYPPSATYIPPTIPSNPPFSAGSSSPAPASPRSPSRSPRSSPSPAPTPTQPVQPRTGANNAPSSSSTSSFSTSSSSSAPTTHHRILDHCFHVSIETRLKQAEAQYLASMQEQALEHQAQGQEGQDEGAQAQTQTQSQGRDQVKQEDLRRRQRSLVDEAVVLSRKGSNVEAIVDGILKSHRSSGPLQTLPRHLKHRLHLCQLTSMVFGRFDVASSTNNSAGLNIYSAFHSRRHGASRAAIKYRFSHSEQGKLLESLLAHPIPGSLYCRRHHRRDCKRTCCTLAKLQQEQQQALELKKKMANNYFMNSSASVNSHGKQDQHQHQRVTGLVDAIPAFLKCSAMSYRDIAKGMVDKGEMDDIKDMKVMEGWYRLLLETMTQAAIESYLCDEDTSFDTVLDVFSFGDDPENTAAALKDFTMEESTESPTPPSPSSSSSSTIPGVEGLQFQSLSSLGSATAMPSSIKGPFQNSPGGTATVLHDVTTQDRQDDILFAKTPEYEAFKAAKDARLQEFLTLNGLTMEQHFADLAAKYPLIVFERQMTHFIIRCQKLLVDPNLSQNPSGDSHAMMGLMIPPTTSAYADGSLSMPVSEDEDEDEDMEEGRIKLEEIKEEEDDYDVEQADEIAYDRKARRESVVVIKEERRSRDGGESDDDSSTAARVVQMSKKHKHHNATAVATNTSSTGESTIDDAGHAAKKVKV